MARILASVPERGFLNDLAGAAEASNFLLSNAAMNSGAVRPFAVHGLRLVSVRAGGLANLKVSVKASSPPPLLAFLSGNFLFCVHIFTSLFLDPDEKETRDAV